MGKSKYNVQKSTLDIICSSKLTIFLELRSRKTVRFSEQIMSADKFAPNGGYCLFISKGAVVSLNLTLLLRLTSLLNALIERSIYK